MDQLRCQSSKIQHQNLWSGGLGLHHNSSTQLAHTHLLGLNHRVLLRAGHAKVAELDHVIVVHQDVRGLQVPVDDRRHQSVEVVHPFGKGGNSRGKGSIFVGYVGMKGNCKALWKIKLTKSPRALLYNAIGGRDRVFYS